MRKEEVKMKNRLIELLGEASQIWDESPLSSFNELCADHLLANGVIVPPCKVGDTVWFNTFKQNASVCVGVQPHKVDHIEVTLICDSDNLVKTRIPDWRIGKDVFLTREDAEIENKQ